jgi:hypothetical protein
MNKEKATHPQLAESFYSSTIHQWSYRYTS